MNDKNRIALLGLILLGMALAAVLFIYGNDIAVLNPRGSIANKERRLMITATLLMLVVVIPVYILTFSIAWKYRAGNKKAKYTPEWDHHKTIESIWWAIPAFIILILGLVTWKSSHQLDPFKQLSSKSQTMTIQVVALQWKWLFIYPQQNVASVNFVQFPQSTAIDFAITADAPMNSFWIPKLGGQIYAMPGMTTHLHLIADETGSYSGSSANISGKGFAGMKFMARSSSQIEFDQWVESIKDMTPQLSPDEYNRLARPSQNNPATYYSSLSTGLFNQIVIKYIRPSPTLLKGSAQILTAGSQ